MYNILGYRLDIYGDMRYNLKRICKKILAISLAALIMLGALTANCFAFEEETGISVQEERGLFLEASVSDGGGCIEVVMSSSHAACGVLATLSYDPESFSFLTFAKSDTLSDQATVSCSDSGGNLRILIDAGGNFERGVWCRFFFSINETKLNKSAIGELFSEISVSVESAYVLSESGYSELGFEGSSARLDLREHLDQDQTIVEKNDDVSVQWVDFGYAFEEYCSVCISGYADMEDLAAGFEITASYENLTEVYTASRVLPLTADDRRGYTVMMLLPLRDAVYVTIRAIRYSARETVEAEKTYCFFVSGAGIERIGFDR